MFTIGKVINVFMLIYYVVKKNNLLVGID